MLPADKRTTDSISKKEPTPRHLLGQTSEMSVKNHFGSNTSSIEDQARIGVLGMQYLLMSSDWCSAE